VLSRQRRKKGCAISSCNTATLQHLQHERRLRLDAGVFRVAGKKRQWPEGKVPRIIFGGQGHLEDLPAGAAGGRRRSAVSQSYPPRVGSPRCAADVSGAARWAGIKSTASPRASWRRIKATSPPDDDPGGTPISAHRRSDESGGLFRSPRQRPVCIQMPAGFRRWWKKCSRTPSGGTGDENQNGREVSLNTPSARPP
jgi:hypothetical protein